MHILKLFCRDTCICQGRTVLFQGTLILPCAYHQKSHSIRNSTDLFSSVPALLRGIEIRRGFGQVDELDVRVFAKHPLVSLERCVDAMSNINATLLKRRNRVLIYGTNVLLLKLWVDILKNCLASSTTALNTVSLLRPPACGTFTGVPMGASICAPLRHCG